jgi:hypothetical protein
MLESGRRSTQQFGPEPEWVRESIGKLELRDGLKDLFAGVKEENEY